LRACSNGIQPQPQQWHNIKEAIEILVMEKSDKRKKKKAATTDKASRGKMKSLR
jgi:hypothetical protein